MICTKFIKTRTPLNKFDTFSPKASFKMSKIGAQFCPKAHEHSSNERN